MKSANDVIESIMLDCFQQVPFHNLFYLLGQPPKRLNLGGTCTDKVSHFISMLDWYGIKAKFHTGLLKSQYSHRLAVIDIAGYQYYADVGNAWPSIHLFPNKGEYTYTSYGVDFLSKACDDCVEITQCVDGKKSWILSVPKEVRCGREENREISKRYDKEQPFSEGIRFAQVIDNRFVFLKHNSVRVYIEGSPVYEEHLNNDECLLYIEDVFHFDLRGIKKRLKYILSNVHD